MTDNGGASTAQAILVDAHAPNLLPVAVATVSPASGPAPLDVVLSAAGSYDPDGFIGNIHWTFSDGGESWGSPAYYTFSETGAHSAEMTVFDSQGATASTTVNVQVGGANQAPTAAASANPASGSAPLAVAFSSAGSGDPDGSIAAYSWLFGDGATSGAPNPSHTYAGAGVYTATLTVTDDLGATSAPASVTVTVTATGILRSTAITLTTSGRRPTFTIDGKVQVRDGQGAAVAGASVSATWTVPANTTIPQTALTNASGVASFTVTGGKGMYRLAITDIAKAGYVFDAAGSVLSKSIRK